MSKFTPTNNRAILLQLGVYFSLAYIIAWGTWFPSFQHPDTLKLLSFIGLFAPAISGIVVAYIADKKQGVKELLGRYRKIRFKTGWYGFVILFIPLLFIIALLIDGFFFPIKINHLLLPQAPLIVLVSFI